MAKKRKAKTGMLEPPQPPVDVTKDIDDIFAIKKAASPSSKSKKPSSTVAANSAETQRKTAPGDLASVQEQVEAAKAKGPSGLSQKEREDAFADIRGTKKSTISVQREGC
jgi:hypothetical protein